MAPGEKQGIWSSVFSRQGKNTGEFKSNTGKNLYNTGKKIGSFLDVGLSTYRFKYRFKLRGSTWGCGRMLFTHFRAVVIKFLSWGGTSQ